MKQFITICAAVCLVAVSAGATTVNYTVGYWGGLPPTYQGNSWYGDTLEFLTFSGSLNLTPGTQTLKINTFDWVIDATSYTANYDFPVTAARSISFAAGPSGSLSQSGLLQAHLDNDYVTFNAGSTVTFTVQGYTVDVTPLGFSRTGGENGEPFTGLPWYQNSSDVMATFVVTPEPATMALLGLGALLFARKKK
jgi:hypothetical protein